MVLSYPELPLDVVRGHALQRKLVCRTFSDCTTAPRHGLISGCYPLDEHYKRLPQRDQLNLSYPLSVRDVVRMGRPPRTPFAGGAAVGCSGG